jgi:hypothetical protein
MKNTKEEFIQEVYNDPMYTKVINAVTGSERQMVETSVNNFINELAWPLLECFSTIASDPELLAALKTSTK